LATSITRTGPAHGQVLEFLPGETANLLIDAAVPAARVLQEVSRGPQSEPPSRRAELRRCG
jgi:hypothetical protein